MRVQMHIHILSIDLRGLYSVLSTIEISEQLPCEISSNSEIPSECHGDSLYRVKLCMG